MGIENLASVTAEHATTYAHHLKAERKLSANTWNKHIRLLRLVFEVVGKQEKLQDNPFADLKTKREVQQHRRELTLEAITKLIEAAEGEMKTLILIGLYTGQRLGDCCTLKWDQVDLRNDIIRVMPRKTRRRNPETLQIHMHRCLKDHLQELHASSHDSYLMPELAKLYQDKRDQVTDRFQRLLVAVGIDPYVEGTGPGTKKRAVVRYGFHSLRHSAVTLLAEAGTPLAVTQKLIGHRSPAISARYTHVGDKALKEAVSNLPDLSGEAPVQPTTSADAKLAQIRDCLAAQKRDSALKRQLQDILAS